MTDLKLFRESGETIENNSEIKLVSDKIYKFMELCEFNPETITEYCDWSAQNYLPAVISAKIDTAPDGAVLKITSNTDNRILPISENSAVFTNLFPGYKYKCTVCLNGSVISNEISFTTANLLPRTLSIDGIDNERDFGGTVTPEGKRVKLGMLYRGSNLKSLSDKGLNTFLNELKIRTELDTSGGDESNPQLVGKLNLAFYSTKWYTLIFDTPECHPLLRDAIKVFANPDNFPIYVHCSLGRDRTGTIAFIVKALCGCSREQLYREQFLSFFSLRGDGEKAGIPAHLGNIDSLYGRFMSEYGENNTIFENVRTFMNQIGVTDEDIANIRKNLLE